MKRYRYLVAALLVFALLLCGCSADSRNREASVWADMTPDGSMDLQYAEQFSVDYYGDYALITIGDADRYLVVPESAQVPQGLDADITIIAQPLQKTYLAASSAMDFFIQLGRMDMVAFTSTKRADWSLDAVRQALDDGTLTYVGKYSAPDYEQLLAEGSSLAIESTMIYHSPEIREQLETLGIPVLVEKSSYESHPLGRMEWIRLYGLLLGQDAEAEQFYQNQVAQLEPVLTGEQTGNTVAFFYITSSGSAVVRKPGDYISRMIDMAGGKYTFADMEIPVEDRNNLSTLQLDLETFYAGAKDADILIYNSAIDGELQTTEQLLQKCPLLADFRAVQNGNVWCTGKNMFQQTTGVSGMILDLHEIITGTDREQLEYVHRLQ